MGEPALNELVELVYRNLPAARAAMARIEVRREAWRAGKLDRMRADIRMRAQLAEVAREIVLGDPGLTFVDDAASVGGAPWYQRRVRTEDGDQVWWIHRFEQLQGKKAWPGPGPLLGHVLSLVRCAADSGFDVASHDGPTCAVEGRRRSPSASAMSEHEMISEFYPELVKLPDYSPALEYHALLGEEVASCEAHRLLAAWWETAVLLLMFSLPDFDGVVVDAPVVLPWESASADEYSGWARGDLAKHVLPPAALRKLIESTSEALRRFPLIHEAEQNAKRDRARKPRSSGLSFPGYIARTKACKDHQVAGSTMTDWTSGSPPKVRSKKDEDTGVMFVHEADLRVQLDKRGRLKH